MSFFFSNSSIIGKLFLCMHTLKLDFHNIPCYVYMVVYKMIERKFGR